jgi:ABC-type lipoprotein release transport system permease subunit
MRIEAFISLRYLKKRKKQNIALLCAITIGVAIFLGVSSILGGWADIVLSKTVELSIGHVVVFPSSDEAFIENYQEVINNIRSLESVVACSPRLEVESIVTHEQNTLALVLTGIQPEDEVKVLKVGEHVKEGRFLQSGDEHSAVLGDEIAKKLNATIGSKLKIVSLGKEIEVSVVGIVDSGMHEIDASLFYITFQDAVSLVGKEVATKIVVRTKSYEDAEKVAEKLKGMGLNAKSWQELAKPILETIRIEGLYTTIISLLLLAVVALGILNVSYMMVSEKTGDIGILKALGLSNKQILMIFLLNNLMLAIIGSILGCLLGTLIAMHFSNLELPEEFYGISRIPVHLNPELYLLSSLLAIGIVGIASLLPARKASKLNPVEAIRYVF